MSGTVIAIATASVSFSATMNQSRSIDELEVERVGVEILLGVRHESPVARPRRVVDAGEVVEFAAQVPARHLADAGSRAWSRPARRSRAAPGSIFLAVLDVQLPHQQIHRLLQTGRLAALLVVRRVPGLLDHRLALEALDQHPALVVELEVHRPDHPVAAAPAQPARRGLEQRVEHLLVVLELQKAEHSPIGSRGTGCRHGRSEP